jgi:RNA-directed DNA polymerase
VGKLSDFRALESTPVDWMDEVASESVLNQAYAWLCERRRDYSANDDVWDVRWQWEELRPKLQVWLRAGVYRLGAVRRFPAGDGTIEVWPAVDALVLKATALVLTAHWLPNLSPLCHHIEGRGGAKAAVRLVLGRRTDNTFVFRTDVKSYYASIDHDILLAILERVVPDGRVRELLRQYVRRTIYDGDLYEDVERGVSLGCPLSPLMGALYLTLLDQRMDATGLTYARFMDGWVILAPTRWKLQAAIRLVKETLAELKLQQHPDKTFIGRISRGFDFLGYLFTPAGLEVAQRAVENCVERVSRLYEQGADLIRIGTYVRRWLCWARGSLHSLGRDLSLRALDLVVRSLSASGFTIGRYLSAYGDTASQKHRPVHTPRRARRG